MSQPVRNGLYWVWYNTDRRTSTWFLTRVNNGHCQFIGAKLKFAAVRLIQDDHHFMRIPDREVLAANLPGNSTPEQILEAFNPPKFTPYQYLRYTKGNHASAVI